MPANTPYFLDTNILLYCFDKTDPRKKEIAELLVDQATTKGSGVISYQVCQFPLMPRFPGRYPGRGR